VVVTPIVAGTLSGIERIAQQENNKIVSALGAVAMFAISRGLSGSNAINNLGALKDVAGSGMLAAPNFKDQPAIDGSTAGALVADPDPIIYVATMDVGHTQSERLGESTLYLVFPKSMQGEIFNGKPLVIMKYGPTFSGVFARAVLRSANLAPPAAGTAIIGGEAR
jgi:hypothetical protein